jgi:hypothetical protein
MYQNNLALTETMWPTDTLERFLKGKQPEISKTVTIRGQPGYIGAEGGNTIAIVWFENGIEYQIYGVYDGQPVEVWLAIAESMK